MKFTIEIPDDIKTVVPLSELEPEVEYREALLGDYFLSTSGSVVQSIGKGAGVERIVFTCKPKPEPPKWLGAAISDLEKKVCWVCWLHPNCVTYVNDSGQIGSIQRNVFARDFQLRPDIMPPSPELAALFAGGEA